MLLLKYYLEDYEQLDIETRCDIYTALRDGYKEGTLSRQQIQSIVLYVYGYSLEEISARLKQPALELVTSTLLYLESKTRITDYGIIMKHKGEVQAQWMSKAQKIAHEELALYGLHTEMEMM
jgi:hypothetical protein